MVECLHGYVKACNLLRLFSGVLNNKMMSSIKLENMTKKLPYQITLLYEKQ